MIWGRNCFGCILWNEIRNINSYTHLSIHRQTNERRKQHKEGENHHRFITWQSIIENTHCGSLIISLDWLEPFFVTRFYYCGGRSHTTKIKLFSRAGWFRHEAQNHSRKHVKRTLECAIYHYHCAERERNKLHFWNFDWRLYGSRYEAITTKTGPFVWSTISCFFASLDSFSSVALSLDHCYPFDSRHLVSFVISGHYCFRKTSLYDIAYAPARVDLIGPNKQTTNFTDFSVTRNTTRERKR